MKRKATPATRAIVAGTIAAAAVSFAASTSSHASPASSAPTPGSPRQPRPPSAEAPPRPIVGILELNTQGIDAATIAGFEKKLSEQLDTGHFWLASRDRMRELLTGAVDWYPGCRGGPCLAVAKTQTGAQLVVTISLVGNGTTFDSVITSLRTDTGEVVAQRSDRCDACTVSEAIDQWVLNAIAVVALAPDQFVDSNASLAAKRNAQLESQTSARRADRRRMRAVGATLLGAGAAMLGAGLIIRYGDDDRRWLGYGLTGAGAGLVVSGGIVLSF